MVGRRTEAISLCRSFVPEVLVVFVLIEDDRLRPICLKFDTQSIFLYLNAADRIDQVDSNCLVLVSVKGLDH